MICHVSKFYKSRISSGVFFFFLALLQGLWDLCSLARNQTWATAAEESGSNHWTAREFPEISVYAAFQMFYNHTWLVAAVLDSMVLTTSAHVDLYNFMEHSEVGFSHTGDPVVLQKSVHACSVMLFAIPQTVAYQAPLSMGFPKQEYWPLQ